MQLLWTINGHRSQPQFRRLVHVVSGIHRLQLLQNCHYQFFCTCPIAAYIVYLKISQQKFWYRCTNSVQCVVGSEPTHHHLLLLISTISITSSVSRSFYTTKCHQLDNLITLFTMSCWNKLLYCVLDIQSNLVFIPFQNQILSAKL